MLGEVDALFSLLDRAKKYFSRSRSESPEKSIAARFVKLFKVHGVHRNQIPRFFDHGLTAAQVQNDDALLQALTEEMLTDASELFAVRREWLDGASSQIYQHNHFYKRPERFAEFIDKLLMRSSYVGGQLFVEQNTSTRRDIYSLLVLEEQVGSIGEKTICRYHLCDFECFNYWKTRAYLTACVAQAWEHKIYVQGGFLDSEVMSELEEGAGFIAIDRHSGGIAHHGSRWNPEDLAMVPEVFLQNLDEGRTGRILALDKWLDLESEGWMQCGFGSPPRATFERELVRLRSLSPRARIAQ